MSENAREAWRLLQSLTRSERGRLPAIAAQAGLAPGQVLALCSLDPAKPMAMSDLAATLACDNSNVTGIIDRLEQRGLVQRRPAERDRRVKMLVVTAAGARVRQDLRSALSEPPAALAGLPAADQRVLRDLLRRAMGAAASRAAAPGP